MRGDRRKKTVWTLFSDVLLFSQFNYQFCLVPKNVESDFQFDWNVILEDDTYLCLFKVSQAKCALNFISRRPVSNRKARSFFKKWCSIQPSWHCTSRLFMTLVSIPDRRHNCPPRKLESWGCCFQWRRSMECPWFVFKSPLLLNVKVNGRWPFIVQLGLSTDEASENKTMENSHSLCSGFISLQFD